MRLLYCWVSLHYPLALGWVLFSLPSITATSFVRNYPYCPEWIRSSLSSTCIYAASSCALAPSFLIRFHRLPTSSSKNAPTSYTPTPYADLELGDSVDHESRACIVDYQDESVGVSAHAPAQGVDEGAPSGGKEEQVCDVCAHSHGDRRSASRRKRILRGGRQRRGRSGQRRRGGGGTGAS